MKTFRTFLKEGGNVFKGKTTSIKKEFIETTIEKYFEELKKIFPKKAKIMYYTTDRKDKKGFHAVGSVGKKPVSGDIDLAVDETEIFGKVPLKESDLDTVAGEWGLDLARVKEDYAKMKKAARTATEDKLVRRAIMTNVCNVIEEKSTLIGVDPKKSGFGNIFGYFPQFDDKGKKTSNGVQLDWMVGHLPWLMFSYYSDTYQGNIKGLHRTQFILSMFGAKGLSFNHASGVTVKGTDDKVAGTPEEAIKKLGDLYKMNITEDTLNNYTKLREQLKKEATEEEYNKVLDTFLKILDSTRCDIPEDIQDYWIKNQTRLALKGKFLPADSKLYDKATEHEPKSEE